MKSELKEHLKFELMGDTEVTKLISHSVKKNGSFVTTMFHEKYVAYQDAIFKGTMEDKIIESDLGYYSIKSWDYDNGDRLILFIQADSSAEIFLITGRSVNPIELLHKFITGSLTAEVNQALNS